MSGLIAPPDNTAPAGQIVAADGWFPDIDTETLRQTVRLGDGVVTPARLVAAVEGAMITALKALAAWRSARATAGAPGLSAVTAIEVGGRNMAVVLWERVVTYYAAAELADLHTDIAATGEALSRQDEKAGMADHYRRIAHAAVADLLALGAEAGAAPGRNRVELL